MLLCSAGFPRETLLVLLVILPQLTAMRFGILFGSRLIFGIRHAFKLGERVLLSKELYFSLFCVFDFGVLPI